jgi:predicted esterase
MVPRVAVVILVAWALAGTAHGAPARDADVIELPAASEPVPLVVILHGDREHAAAAAARWRAVVKKRGWALLALECPHDLGCKDSWWQWDGDPAWVLDRITKVKAGLAISKVIVVGWSGGASYLGARAQAWTGVDALVIHGGGMAPTSSECVAGPPVYFLVGDKNPLHKLAISLHDYFTACKREVTWDVVKGADHEREASALTAKKAGAILDWAVAH